MNKPIVVERFSDNGEHDHWELVGDNGETLWEEKGGEEQQTYRGRPLSEYVAWGMPGGPVWIGSASLRKSEGEEENYANGEKIR